MTATFMLKRVNERKRRVRASWCCPPSQRDSSCTRRPGYTEVLFDVAVAHTGKILGRDVFWEASLKLPDGAMYWGRTTEAQRPQGPDDYDGYDDEQLARIRKTFAEYPQHFPGALEDDPTLPVRRPSHTFDDGPHLHVIVPGGDGWNIDSRAGNCGLPYDYAHRCWVRTGEPPRVTVGKGGLTCPAGGGSIATPNYHGFLQDGRFTPNM